MSGVDWNGILRLPDAALAGCRRIPKTVLVKQAMLTNTEQKRLDKVARLEHFATVQKSTTRIPPYEDDERNVQSVVFLRCEMTAGTMAVAEVAELVHKCFPNPTVLLVEANGRACVSVALTRRSQAEQGATVVDRVESTGAFDPGRSEYADFLGAWHSGGSRRTTSGSTCSTWRASWCCPARLAAWGSTPYAPLETGRS